ncbi:hypothetical protein EPN81_04175 [Patescibacteria group bacterium]|nr:MAG: hypothetical protein EPN81_04175 [Patescibacteria group bacterium]
MSVVASYTGVKFFVDLGAKGWQTLVSNPAERRRIQNALLAKERELGETTEPSAIDQKKAKLEEAINASKFLTKEKKADLLTTLSEIVEIYKESTGAAIKARDKEILEKLEKAIQTRVKNTQLLKEGLNTALMATGLAAMRGVAYGAVASYERYKQVAQERTEGKRRGTQFNEWIVKGFTETLHNLVGGKEKFFSTKGAMNVVKGATNVLRAAGFADLAISEYLEEGGPSKMIEASLKAWEEKSPTEFLTDNIQDQWKRLASLGKYAKTAIAGLQSEPGVTPEIPDELPADADDGSTVPEEVVTAGAVGAAGVAAAESARHVEAPEVHVEENLVKKGDGIIKVLERQGVPKTSAIEAAQEAGIIRAGGDTRLTTQAIGRLSVFTETQPDGDLEIKFVDTKTDKVLTLAQAREAGFTYESGTVPGELATEEEVASHVPETAGVFKDSPDVPNDLLEGTFHLYTDSEGNFTYLDPGAGDKLVRMNEALQELAKQDHEQSPEAKFIWQQYERHLLAIEGVQVDAPLPPDTAPVAPQAAVGQQSALPETQGDTEPLRKFDGEAGVVKFVYDKTTGEVKDAFLPAYTPGKTEIRDSLKEWGLTPQEVKEKFEQDHGGAWSGDSHPDRYPPGERPGASIQSAANDYRQFTREVTKLSRQESLLREMEEQGFARTPEYARVKMETEELETFISRQMEKIFHIKERSI